MSHEYEGPQNVPTHVRLTVGEWLDLRVRHDRAVEMLCALAKKYAIESDFVRDQTSPKLRSLIEAGVVAVHRTIAEATRLLAEKDRMLKEASDANVRVVEHSAKLANRASALAAALKARGHEDHCWADALCPKPCTCSQQLVTSKIWEEVQDTGGIVE